MMRALMLSMVVLCACAQSSGDDRLSESPVKAASAATPPPSQPSQPSEPSGTAETTASYDAAVAPVTTPDAGSPDAGASTCKDLSAAFQARLTAASGACTRAADCACFTSIVDSPACAGVTDARSARELDGLVERYRAAGCRLPRRCGPGACAPQCVARRCR
jgi:hypothetical protein